MKKITFLTLLLFCFNSVMFSQSNSLAEKIAANTPALPYSTDNPKCATMDGLEYRVANDPVYAKFYNQARAIPKSSQSAIPCDGTNSIVVPVAFHFAPGVVTCGDSDCLLEEVQDQLDVLNSAFASNTGTGPEAFCPPAYQDAAGNSVASTGTCISFCLAIPPAGGAAGLDPACDPPITVGTFNGGFGAGGNGAPGWGGILNIFITNGNCLGVADGIPGAGNGDGVTTCAEAFGGLDPSSGCNLDDNAAFGLGATTVHEIGHYLGLFHTHNDFGTGCVDNDVNAPGPFTVTDTPIQAAPSFGCSMACVASCTPGDFEPTANFMSFSDDACMSMFTEDQAQVMNFWANQLFGANASQCSDPNPTELTSNCLMEPCVLVCPATVLTPLSETVDVCTISTSSFDLPTDFSAVVLDDASDAVFVWSTGGFLSAGGTVFSGPLAVSPAGCAPLTVTFFLNVDCGTTPFPAGATLDAGMLELTAYPDPSTFVAADLATFTDGDCGVPTWVVTAGCEAFVTVTPLDAPATVNPGDMGTVNYDITLDYPVACCCPETMSTQMESNASTVAIPDGGGPADPGCSTVTIPNGGSITDVIVDVGVTHTYVGDLIITLTSPAGTTITLGDQPGAPAVAFGCAGDDLMVTFDDAAANTAADFENTCNNLPAIAGSYQSIDPLSTFNGEDAAGVWTVCISDNAGVDTGSIINIGVTVDVLDACMDPAGCTIAGTADFACVDTGCPATAATISTTDPTRICVDGVPDPINVSIDDAGMGMNSAWVITDAANTILALPAAPPFDLDGAGPGTCLIWYVNFDDPNFAPALGDDAVAAVAASSCAVLSNPITVDRIEVTAATISTTDPTTICADDGIGDPINVTIDDAGTGGTATAWVITDAMNTILALPAAPPFDLEGAGAGTCLIWLVSTNDATFAPAIGDDAVAAVAAATCATLSNPITVTRQTNCAACTATAATISTTDPTRICVDGVGDPIDVSIDNPGMGTGAWVITDDMNTILALPAAPPFDLDGAGPGTCLIWYVNSDDPAFAPMVGDNAADAVAASSCAFLSNSITVDRIEVTAPTISSPGPSTICADDGIADLIPVDVDDAGIGNPVWVITDDMNMILAIPPAPPFDLEGAGAGTCLIWLANVDDPAFMPSIGDDAVAAIEGATCAVLSNPIAVVREINCGVCEEEVTYNVSALGCDMTGANIELQDAAGATIATMALGADGGTGTFGVQSCGDYIFVITGAPACYTDNGGDVGPRMFMVDGTGTTLESFSLLPANIPTVGEWGLIILGLMMSIVAIIGIRERRREEVYG